MIVAVHQPHFLPWLGYLERMHRADLFIVLDHVQFERRNYQNRTQILVDGQSHWLTVPVVQESQQERLIDKRIDNHPTSARRWSTRHYQTLRHAYRKAPFLETYAPPLRQLLDSPPERLADMDRRSLDFLRQAFDIHTPLVNSSELKVDGSRSALILNLCKAVGADTYLAGMGGSRHYLDRQAFADAGIGIIWQDFRHPVYAQCNDGPFVPGLSAIDLLFNHGPRGRRLLTGDG